MSTILSDTDRTRIAELRRNRLTLREIADDVGCSISTVQRLIPDDLRAEFQRPLTDEEKRYVHNQLEHGRNQAQIASDLRRSPVVIADHAQLLSTQQPPPAVGCDGLIESHTIDLMMAAWERNEITIGDLIRAIDLQLNRQLGANHPCSQL